MRDRFHGLLLPAVLTLAALALLVSLGNWQLSRLAWKEGLIAQVAERPLGAPSPLPPASEWQAFNVADGEYRPYRLSGRFRHDKEALVFTSLSDAKGLYSGPGFWVVTPLELATGGTILVNRGFAPQGREQIQARGETLPEGAITVIGLMRPDDEPGVFTPDSRPEANIFFARNIEAIATAKGIAGPVAPFTIDLVAAATPPSGLPQAGETRMRFSNDHLGYAVTWYGLAAALLAVFGSFVWARLHGKPAGPRLTQPGQAP